ncbi:hypothetical protein ES705_11440 [subsurface metagenome]
MWGAWGKLDDPSYGGMVFFGAGGMVFFGVGGMVIFGTGGMGEF